MRAQVEALPGMPALLEALDSPAWLVGGGVRDLLRDVAPLDIDLAIEGDAVAAARDLAARLGGAVVEHDRFGTATVTGLPLELNLATTRRETYAHPGALPDVEPAGLEEDLARRDFTVNAMAIGLTGEDLGALQDPHGGRADLDAGLVRVLHERSFLDDPTRLLRAVRYVARIGGRLEPRTEELAREAIAQGAPGTVSGNRIRDELLDLLQEDPAALELMRSLELDRALHPALRADPDRVASARLAAGETGADPVLAALAALVAGDGEPARVGGGAVPAAGHAHAAEAGDADALRPWLDGLGLRRDQRDRVARAAVEGPGLATTLHDDMPPSQLHSLMHLEPPETLATALAFGAPGGPILRYVRDLSGARLEVTGDDLIAAGVPQSPALGHALEETLRRKLDGEVSGRDDELRLALELAREHR
jgi:tRNA nucleotidyltransferase (CCA-adding enzyme)